MRLPPLEVLANWPEPNYEHPVTRGPANVIFNSTLFPIVAVLISIRVYTRLRISKSFGIDDWLIVAAAFPTTAFSVLTMVTELDMGWNRHIWDVKFTDTAVIALGLKLIIVTQVMFGLATTLIKCSMLTLTYRILTSASSRLRPWILVAMVVIILEGIAFCFVVTFQCRPISQYWTISFTEQKCIHEPKNLLAAGIINTCTDFIVVILPIPTVLGVKIRLRGTIILILLFTAGFLATSAGGARTFYTYKVTVSDDKTWDIYYAWLSSSVELYTGLICASIPATKQFFTHRLPFFIHTGEYSRSTRTLSMDFESSAISYPNYSPYLSGTYADTVKSHDDIVLNQFITEPPKAHTKLEEQDSIRIDTVVEQTTRFDTGRYDSETRATSIWDDANGTKILRTESGDQLVK